MDLTQSVCLNKLSDTDECAMVALLTNNIVKKTYMLPDFQSPAEAANLFQRLKELSHCPERYVRGIYLGSQLIGLINDVEIAGSAIELGWAIHPDYHNRGYGTQAVKTAIEELFRHGFREIIAGAFIENKASFRVMEKAGMQPISRQDDVQYRGKTHLCNYYSAKN